MAFKTKFNMYVPCDFHTYKKLKKVKAVINLSHIQRVRFDKWFRKEPQNRTRPEPKPCPAFWKRSTRKTWGGDVVAYYEPVLTKDGHSLQSIFYKAWKVAATPKHSPEEVEQPVFDESILDDIYEQCVQWFEGEYMKSRKQKCDR